MKSFLLTAGMVLGSLLVFFGYEKMAAYQSGLIEQARQSEGNKSVRMNHPSHAKPDMEQQEESAEEAWKRLEWEEKRRQEREKRRQELNRTLNTYGEISQ